MGRNTLRIIIALIAIVFPVYSWICWTIVFQSGKYSSQGERQTAFLKYFPSAIQELNTITLINLLSLLIAMLFSFIAARRSVGGQRSLAIFVFTVAGILTALTLLA